MTKDTILYAGTKRNQQLKNVERFMDRKAEQVKNYIFRELRPIFWYFWYSHYILPKNFATTVTTTYIQNIHLDIFIKKLFSND